MSLHTPDMPGLCIWRLWNLIQICLGEIPRTRKNHWRKLKERQQLLDVVCRFPLEEKSGFSVKLNSAVAHLFTRQISPSSPSLLQRAKGGCRECAKWTVQHFCASPVSLFSGIFVLKRSFVRKRDRQHNLTEHAIAACHLLSYWANKILMQIISLYYRHVVRPVCRDVSKVVLTGCQKPWCIDWLFDTKTSVMMLGWTTGHNFSPTKLTKWTDVILDVLYTVFHYPFAYVDTYRWLRTPGACWFCGYDCCMMPWIANLVDPLTRDYVKIFQLVSQEISLVTELTKDSAATNIDPLASVL